MNYILLVLAVLLGVWLFKGFRSRRKAAAAPEMSARAAHALMLKHIRFYKRLSRKEQEEFMLRTKAFLDTIPITPVGEVEVTPLDRIYVAAAAIIPVFRFKNWEYRNLNEVLIYPGNFSRSFGQEGEDANVMGMVGDGTMHRMMILSIGALRTGFEQQGRGNTGIHEFVHLIDKQDGAVDGLPEELLTEDLTTSWLSYMHAAIEEIRAGASDINPYAATSEAEFLAVVSEYYSQRPEYLKEGHPELWALLEQMYSAAPEEPAVPADVVKEG